jgi:hypothetical protein
MFSALALSAVDHGFEPPSGQSKDYKICKFICLHVTVDMTNKPCMLCYAHDAQIFAFICNSAYFGFERK